MTYSYMACPTWQPHTSYLPTSCFIAWCHAGMQYVQQLPLWPPALYICFYNYTVHHGVIDIRPPQQAYTDLKLHSLFAACIFWTVHTKSHNIKALVILNHSWSRFLPLNCLYGNNELLWVSVQPSGVFSWEKLIQIINANHMTMTPSGQF